MIEITRYTPIKTDGNTVAYLSIFIPKWKTHFNSLRLIRKKEGGFFVAFPSRKYEDSEGTKYASYVFMEKDMMERFQDATLKAVDAHVKTQQTQKPQDPIDELGEPPF